MGLGDEYDAIIGDGLVDREEAISLISQIGHGMAAKGVPPASPEAVEATNLVAEQYNITDPDVVEGLAVANQTFSDAADKMIASHFSANQTSFGVAAEGSEVHNADPKNPDLDDLAQEHESTLVPPVLK